MRTRSVICLYCITLFFLSCGEQVFYERNIPIKDRSWAYNAIPTFDVKIEDNRARYDLWLNVRHTNEYNYANLFILLHEKGPLLKDTAYRYEVQLARADGRWTGSSAGTIYGRQLLLKENYSFPDTGVYTFGIEQNMVDNPLRDITDVGIKLVKR
ncbi:MAG TPA: gliding motility lipoprotein GldH [Sphingobacterium sp.]|jgi:gliding motility-associated lipoprotein GldH|nr:gliding motility lipoprotein GldH [Sphingobacterium sp.]